MSCRVRVVFLSSMFLFVVGVFHFALAREEDPKDRVVVQPKKREQLFIARKSLVMFEKKNLQTRIIKKIAKYSVVHTRNVIIDPVSKKVQWVKAYWIGKNGLTYGWIRGDQLQPYPINNVKNALRNIQGSYFLVSKKKKCLLAGKNFAAVEKAVWGVEYVSLSAGLFLHSTGIAYRPSLYTVAHLLHAKHDQGVLLLTCHGLNKYPIAFPSAHVPRDKRFKKYKRFYLRLGVVGDRLYFRGKVYYKLSNKNM